MLIRQIFQSKRLTVDDINEHVPTIVTIKGVDWAEATNNNGEADALYTVLIEEHRKGFKMNKTVAGQIARVLGSEDTDDWIGKQIAIIPATEEMNGQQYDVIRVYTPRQVGGPIIPPTALPFPSNHSRMMAAHNARAPRHIGGGQAAGRIVETQTPQAQIDMTSMGQGASDRMLDTIRGFGGTWDACLVWIKNNAPREIFDCMFGVALPDLPVGVRPWVMRYIKSLPDYEEPASQQTPPAPPPPPPPPPAPAHELIDEDDIPF